MPSFKFQGFATGQAVALSATQSGETVSANVATWGETTPSSGDMTLTVSANRTSGVAPMGALLMADATSNATRVVSPYHDIEGVWDYDDPGNYTALGNAPIWGTDRNVGYGPRSMHVFSEHGAHTVAHTAYDGDGQITDTITINVEDPDVVFAGQDTAVLSSSGFSGAPAGAAQFTNLASALSHLAGRTNQRLLIHAQETVTQGISIDDNSCERLYIGRFGQSSNSQKPFLDKRGHNDDAIYVDGNSLTEITICDLNIEGWYDPTSTSQPDNFKNGGSALKLDTNSRLAHKTIWNVDTTNIPRFVLDVSITAVETPTENLYVGNCKCIGWGDYFVIGGTTKNWGFAGNTLQQPTGTVNGPGKDGTDPHWPEHGTIRMTRALGLTVLTNNDMSSFNDWSAGDNSRSMQPVLRWMNGGHVTSPTYDYMNNSELVVDRMMAEGGVIGVHTGTNHATVGDNWVVMDRIHGIVTPHPKQSIESPMGGVTWRNGIFVLPNSKPGVATGTQKFFTDVSSDPYQPGAGVRRSEFYSNTVADLRSNANATNRTGSNTHGHVTGGYTALSGPTYFGENIIHAPNMSAGIGGTTAFAPLDSSATRNKLYDGERWQTNPVDTTRGYGNEVTALFRPTAGSPAIGGATGKVSLLDFDGNLRSVVVAGLSRSTLSVGPFEPDLET